MLPKKHTGWSEPGWPASALTALSLPGGVHSANQLIAPMSWGGSQLHPPQHWHSNRASQRTCNGRISGTVLRNTFGQRTLPVQTAPCVGCPAHWPSMQTLLGTGPESRVHHQELRAPVPVSNQMAASRCGAGDQGEKSRPCTWPSPLSLPRSLLLKWPPHRHGSRAPALSQPALPEAGLWLQNKSRKASVGTRLDRETLIWGTPPYLLERAFTLVTMMGVWKSLPPVMRKPQGAGPNTSTVTAIPGEGREREPAPSPMRGALR